MWLIFTGELGPEGMEEDKEWKRRDAEDQPPQAGVRTPAEPGWAPSTGHPANPCSTHLTGPVGGRCLATPETGMWKFSGPRIRPKPQQQQHQIHNPLSHRELMGVFNICFPNYVSNAKEGSEFIYLCKVLEPGT